jgi:hypothetical protein
VKPLSIRLAILSVLRENKPFMTPQVQLLRDVNLLVRPALSPADLVKHLSWLKAQAMVTFEPDPLDPDNADVRKWLIREAGEAALKS